MHSKTHRQLVDTQVESKEDNDRDKSVGILKSSDVHPGKCPHSGIWVYLGECRETGQDFRPIVADGKGSQTPIPRVQGKSTPAEPQE